jgi:hypothetical protein
MGNCLVRRGNEYDVHSFTLRELGEQSASVGQLVCDTSVTDDVTKS